jgi:hypothetical protein
MTHLRSGRPAIIHKGTMFRIRTLRFLLLGLAATVLVVSKPAFAELPATKAQVGTSASSHYLNMSQMGRLARIAADAAAKKPTGAGTNFTAKILPGTTPDEPDDDTDGPAGGQAEVAIAVDVTGQHIVIGFNDTRGFFQNPISVSGFAYSDDGGITFTDGGSLPATGNASLNGLVGGTSYPQVYGDPDVKYVPGGGGLQFVYSSILMKGVGTAPNFSSSAQSLCIHRSFDGGHTWQGPFEVTAATISGGSADKEFIDVDPDTGRVLVSWSNFGFGVDISTAFSDNVMTVSPPTWSGRSILNAGNGGDQGSIPRFAGNSSSNVYVAWGRSSSSQNIGFARSTDNGVTWLPAITLRSPGFFSIDQILGNDRVHQFPGLAVDTSPGKNQGNIYVVYADNNNFDGADIAFQRSTNGGATFSAPVLLNSRPGADRPQWMPYVAVDRNTGRVSVIFYDEGIATSGDLAETTWVISDDGGVTWSKPRPITTRPFHGGYGNDTGQPNLGDYIGATAQNGILYGVSAFTPPSVSFVDGQPDTKFTSPDIYFAAVSNALAPLNLAGVTFTESGGNGFLDPGDNASFSLPLRNYVTNPVNGPIACSGVTATLSTTNPGVLITGPVNSYPNVSPGSIVTNATPFLVTLQPDFAMGTTIEFKLTVTTDQGSTTLLFSQPTGTPVATTLLSENFNGVAVGSLPVGWTAFHQGGNNTVPWITTNNVPAAPDGNALFHINAEDGLSGDGTRWERAVSPSFVIPTNSSFVTLDFDIWTDTEDDTYSPGFNVSCFDGATLRITDLTPGHSVRPNLAEAFAQDFTTGSRFHFPKHLPRSGNSSYFQDMSVWGGDSGGWQHVHMKLPGMAGTTAQLWWEYTQDSNGIATDVRPTHTYCGVAIDNIVLNSISLTNPVVNPPVLLSPAQSSLTNFTFSFATDPARTYLVQFKDDLTAPAWQQFQTVTGNGTIQFITNSMSASSQRFFRLQVQ